MFLGFLGKNKQKTVDAKRVSAREEVYGFPTFEARCPFCGDGVVVFHIARRKCELKENPCKHYRNNTESLGSVKVTFAG